MPAGAGGYAMADLLHAFEDIWSKVTDDVEGSSCLRLYSGNLPPPPPVLETDRLCITKYLHFYGDFPVDGVSFEGDKAALGRLGLLIFSVALRPRQPRVTLNLTHARSTVRRLIIAPASRAVETMPGLHLSPERFNYYPSTVTKHPWLHASLRPCDLPILYLTNERETVLTPNDLETRDVAVGFGGIEGSCRFAELLLNASRPTNDELEFALESEIGFRGVGPGSAEITIWLPGSLGNLDHEIIPDA